MASSITLNVSLIVANALKYAPSTPGLNAASYKKIIQMRINYSRFGSLYSLSHILYEFDISLSNISTMGFVSIDYQVEFSELNSRASDFATVEDVN